MTKLIKIEARTGKECNKINKGIEKLVHRYEIRCNMGLIAKFNPLRPEKGIYIRPRFKYSPVTSIKQTDGKQAKLIEITHERTVMQLGKDTFYIYNYATDNQL
jgi:hypothetical protein